MLKAIHRDSRFGQQMVDLNTSLNSYYLLYNVSNFIQMKRADTEKIAYRSTKGFSIGDIIETTLLLLQLASICSDTQFRG